MKGDFSRITFDPKKHYSRVLMQQGRVQLDADWNEQAAIVLHRLETMARDLIGPFGGPVNNCGFEFKPNKTDGKLFQLGEGRYYVDGMLCVNDEATKHSIVALFEQDAVSDQDTDYLLYLDVWEQYLNASEDPEIRETALGGPDTSGRSKVVWSVRTLAYTLQGDIPKAVAGVLTALQLEQENNGRLNVTVEDRTGHEPDDGPCISSPDARFRGLENQLYRVEIHNGDSKSSTFKWSRENGSVIFPITAREGASMVLEPGYSTMGLKSGDWVELVDDDLTAGAKLGPLQQVKSVDAVKREIRLTTEMSHAVDPKKHPFLRRWESGVISIEEGKEFPLEDGIRIQFVKAAGSVKVTYRSGDYWCFPARTAGKGNIAWPPGGAPPDGVIHHYAPLAAISYVPGGTLTLVSDCRKIFHGLAVPK